MKRALHMMVKSPAEHAWSGEIDIRVLHIIDAAGNSAVVPNVDGRSVMESVLESDATGPFGLCGGNRSCGTCHIYVEPAILELLSPASEDERTLLEFSEHLMPTSRLACQIEMPATVAHMTVTIAPQDQ